MEFRMELTLPATAPRIWEVLVDVPRIAACIPGCEDVQEHERLGRYSAVMKQKVGPFKLEVPAEIVVERCDEPSAVIARATGKDKYTRTSLDVLLGVTIEPDGAEACRLVVTSTVQIAGRLASLGFSVIKKRAEENFAEFEKRFTAAVGGA